jgi:Kef-type K+ transport system membrane component KefB
VTTNLIMALIFSLTAGTRDSTPSWLSTLGFWAMNLGLLVFLVGLGQDLAEVKRLGAPTMGVGILLVLYVLAMRLWRSTGMSRA